MPGKHGTWPPPGNLPHILREASGVLAAAELLYACPILRPALVTWRHSTLRNRHRGPRQAEALRPVAQGAGLRGSGEHLQDQRQGARGLGGDGGHGGCEGVHGRAQEAQVRQAVAG